MSAEKWSTVRCDGKSNCRHRAEPWRSPETISQARKALRNLGWLVGIHGRDLCPTCREDPIHRSRIYNREDDE